MVRSGHLNSYPLGMKGIGESGTVGATPAVQNAVLDALAPYGVTHLDMPLTPLKIWEALASPAGKVSTGQPPTVPAQTLQSGSAST